jgi:hypothetical protein
MRHQVLGDSLANKLGVPYSEVLQGKGGFWVKGKGFFTLAKARTMTGITAPKQKPRLVQSAWGDWATVVMLNQKRQCSDGS